MKKQILKVLVGSRAHGTHTTNSDYDFRGVHVIPTSELVSLDFKYQPTSWVEGESEDQTSYELAEFCKLAIQNHPNILEMFMTDMSTVDVVCDEIGEKLLSLFPYFYDSKKAFKAFINYADNRRKNMFNAINEHVAIKSAYCHVRVLLNLCDLLATGSFSLEITDPHRLSILQDIKNGKWSNGNVIDYGESIIRECSDLLVKITHNEQDLDVIKNFVIETRKKVW